MDEAGVLGAVENAAKKKPSSCGRVYPGIKMDDFFDGSRVLLALDDPKETVLFLYDALRSKGFDGLFRVGLVGKALHDGCLPVSSRLLPEVP
jgi:hypothetical protein